MKIRPITPPPDVSIEYLVEEWKGCRELVMVYWKARKEHRTQDAHSARMQIEPYVPMGVYKRGGTDQHFVVYGMILSSRKLLDPDRLFVVPMLPIEEVRKDMKIEDIKALGAWHNVPFIDTDGFMAPIVGDFPQKRRFTRVGEIVLH